MDDHQPSWESNGEGHLRSIMQGSATLLPSTTRLNFFLPVASDALATPVNAIALAKGLVENFSLTSLELYRCNLTAADIAALAQALSVNKYITYLGLGRNRFFTEGGVMLCEALKVNQTIVTIDLSWNELRDEFAIAMAETLSMNNSIQRLLLDRNKISGDGISALSHSFSTNRKLRYISLAQNNMNAFGLGYLGKSLSANGHSNLMTLDIGGNGINQEGLFSFFTTLATMPRPSTLVTLNLSFNKIGASLVVLGNALAKLPNLRELNLEYTLLSYSTSLVEFANCLGAHPTLVNFNFASNSIDDKGLDVLCEALALQGLSKYVDFSNCGITKVGVEESLTKLLKQCKQLSTLHLSNNNFSEEGCGASIAKLLSNTHSLEFLGLERCRLGSHGIDGMASTLQFKPPSITGLTLRGNKIGDAGFAQFLPFALHHGHFTFLDLSQNELTRFIQPRLPDIFQTNCDLKYLVVEDNTIFTRDNVLQEWDEVAAHTAVEMQYPVVNVPMVNAQYEMPTGLVPSAGFASYSASCGSTVKRQVESTSNLASGLCPYAGQPVKHCNVWAPNACGTTPCLTGSNSGFRNPSDVKTVSKIEGNIGGLLMSDDQLRREFNRLDTKGEGYLNRDDFKRVYRSMEHFGLERSDGEVDRVLHHYGGGTGKIPFDLFCVLMLKLAQH